MTIRICFVCNAFPKLSEIAILNQVRGLAARGCGIRVIAEGFDPDAGSLLDVISENIDIIQIPQRPLSHFRNRWANFLNLRVHGAARAARGLVRAPWLTLRALNPWSSGRAYTRSFWLLYQVMPFLNSRRPVECDVVHAQFGPNGTKAVLLRQLGVFNAPIITTFRGYDLNVLPRQRGARLYELLFRRGDLFTTDSLAMKHKLAGLGCPEDRIVVLPSSVDVDFWDVPDRRPSSIGNSLRIVTAARLVECKGIDVAIQALAAFHRQMPDVEMEYTVVGDGPRRTALEELSRALNVYGVRFLGWQTQEQLKEHLRRSDVFLLPSVISEQGDEESQGLVLQEAQAAGMPVIGARLGGIPEGLKDGVSGLLFTPGDPMDLADTLVRFWERRADWQSMGRAGRDLVRQDFSLDRQTDRLLEIYCRLIAGHKSATSADRCVPVV